MKFYFAGKIKKYCWRHGMVTGLHNAEPDSRPLQRAIGGIHEYTGPFFASCDHGCYHGDNKHGQSAKEELDCMYQAFGVISPDATVRRCSVGVEACDILFAWIDDPTCYGTLVEIGLAKGLRKRIWVASPWEEPGNHWSAFKMADHAELKARDPSSAFENLLLRDQWIVRHHLRSMKYWDYLKTDHWKNTRDEAVKAVGGRCQLCSSMESLNVHHNSYERLGCELQSDLLVLCRPCHSKHHNKLPEA